MISSNVMRALASYLYMFLALTSGFEHFSSHPENVTVTEGDDVFLACETSFSLDCRTRTDVFIYWIARWHGNNTKQEYVSSCDIVYPNLDDEKYSVSINGTLYALQIKSVNRDDSMHEFFCVVYFQANTSMSVSGEAVLTVVMAMATTSSPVVDEVTGSRRPSTNIINSEPPQGTDCIYSSSSHGVDELTGSPRHSPTFSRSLEPSNGTDRIKTVKEAGALSKLTQLIIGSTCAVVFVIIVAVAITLALLRKKHRKRIHRNVANRVQVDMVTWDNEQCDRPMNSRPHGVQEEIPYAELDFEHEPRKYENVTDSRPIRDQDRIICTYADVNGCVSVSRL